MLRDNGSIWSRFTKEDSTKFLWQKEYGKDHPSRLTVVDWLKSKKFKKKPSLLDIPCGSGVDYPNLKDISDYTGMDKTPNLVEGIKERFPEIKAMVGDIREIPCEAESFDIVLARAIFEHLTGLEDVELAMKECLRVAKKYAIFSFYIKPGNNTSILWNGDYFENHYGVNDIQLILAKLEAKSIEEKDVDVDNVNFVDSYKIYFVEK